MDKTIFRLILLTLAAGSIITGCDSGETREGHLTAVMVLSDVGTETNYFPTQFRFITADDQEFEVHASDDVEWLDADDNVTEIARLGDTHRYQLVGEFHEQKGNKPRFAEIDKIIYLGPKK